MLQLLFLVPGMRVTEGGVGGERGYRDWRCIMVDRVFDGGRLANDGALLCGRYINGVDEGERKFRFQAH